MVVTDTVEELVLYADAIGRDLDPAVLTLYRLRWSLDDIAIFVELTWAIFGSIFRHGA